MNPTELLLPPAARLVHIGPHKTGTTSLQHAFHTSRGKLRRHGVHYAGLGEQPLYAAAAVAGTRTMKGQRPARTEDWADLVDEVSGAGNRRVVVSSEFLCYAGDAAARRVVTDIAGGPVHVVVTLRSIVKIAPSQWQQYVQNGLRVPYARWLEGMFRRPPYEKPTPSFWRRHSHGLLVRRWAQAAGAQNLTVVVADESDPRMLLRTFEAFVGLPQGLLMLQQNLTNRSLTRGEAELVRLVNKGFHANGWTGSWSPEVHARLVRQGVVRRMKTGRCPTPSEPRVTMPDWAVERANEVDTDTVEAIKSLGVRVVGDLATLTEVSADRRGGAVALRGPELLPIDAAALAVLGAIKSAGRPSAGDRAAAALAVLSSIGDKRARSDTPDMPLIPAHAAARTVALAIEASDDLAGLAQLPRVPADVARLVVLAASGSATGPDAESASAQFAQLRRVFGALGVRRDLATAAASQAWRLVPVDRRIFETYRVGELLRTVVARCRRQIRRWPYRLTR